MRSSNAEPLLFPAQPVRAPLDAGVAIDAGVALGMLRVVERAALAATVPNSARLKRVEDPIDMSPLIC